MALTKRQKDFLEFLAGFLEKRGYSPSYEEIAEGMDLASLATVHKHILALEAKQYLKRGFNQSRSLEVSPKYYQEQRQHQNAPVSTEIPLLGRIAAGTPVGERIAHGMLVAAMATGMANWTGVFEGTTLALMEQVLQYKGVVRFGDTVHLRLTVAEKKETSKPDRGIVFFDAQVLNQDGQAVQEGRWTLMMRRAAG